MNHLMVYPSDICNFKCDYCLASKWMGQNDHLSPKNVFLEWVYKYITPEEWLVEFTGGGEPAMHPEFVDIINELVSRGYYGIVRTNGSLPIPRTPNFKRIATWHPSHGDKLPEYFDFIVILKNHKDNWRLKEKYCIDNNIPYQLQILQNYCRVKHDRTYEMHSKSLSFIRRCTVVFPEGKLSACNKSYNDEKCNIFNMSKPPTKVPCSACQPLANFEYLYSEEERQFFRDRRDGNL